MTEPYGFKPTFNRTFRVDDSPTGWWVTPYHFGIDQGPVVLMIENYRYRPDLGHHAPVPGPWSPGCGGPGSRAVGSKSWQSSACVRGDTDGGERMALAASSITLLGLWTSFALVTTKAADGAFVAFGLEWLQHMLRAGGDDQFVQACRFDVVLRQAASRALASRSYRPRRA